MHHLGQPQWITGRGSVALMFAGLIVGTDAPAQGDTLVPAQFLTAPQGVEATFRPSTPADLVVASRPILTLRAEVFGNSPERRVHNIHLRLEEALAAGGPCALRDSSLLGGRGILIDGRPLLFISALDIDPSVGEDLDATARRTMELLNTAIADRKEMFDARAMTRNIAFVAGYTVLLAIALFLMGRLRRWIRRKAEALITRGMERTGIKQGLTRSRTLYLVAHRIAMMLIGLLMLVVLFLWLTAVLGRIPLTRAWSDQMFTLIVRAGVWVFDAVVEALPGLGIVAVIFVITRLLARILGSIFDRIATGEIEVTWLDAAIAAPTKRIFVLLLWVFALVIAYPYIPGSSTKAFQGISVLVGIMFSLGSSGVIAQIMSGMAMMFNRLIRVGEAVQVGDVVTGTVRRIGYFNTTIVTGYGEEVTVPNSLVLSTKVTNLSRHAGKGILFTTGVTIGYDAPWRQVHAMLLEAAGITPEIAKDPAPKVNQHALNDFYVDYRLTVVIEGPFRATLTMLHANIQDLFNANGVQIMSPHYEGDPQAAKVVPREKRDPGITKA